MNNIQKLNSLLIASACITLPLFAQTPSRPPLGPLVFTGIVLDGVTGAPIPDAVVLSQDHVVKTDSSGRFLIPDAVAGEVSTIKRGYLQPEDIGACCSRRNVLTAEQPGELHFTLMPKATLAGRVALPSGVPIVSMPVTLLRQEVSQDGLLVWSIASRTNTAADGTFKMSDLMPGDYRLRTDDLVTDRRADGLLLTPDVSQIDGLPRTYLGNNPNGTQAISLHAGDGKIVDLPVAPVPFHRVVVHLGGPPIAGPFGWTLRRDDGTGISLPEAGVSAENQVRFFAPAGRYQLDYTLYPNSDPQTGKLFAWADGSTASFNGTAAFEVRDQPLQVSGNAEHPRAIPVQIAQHFTHPIPSVPRGTVTVRDQDAHSYDTTFNPNLEDQSIDLQPLTPGTYRITLSGGSEFYTASLTCGSFDLLRGPLVIGAPGPPCNIEATLRNDFGVLNVEPDPAGMQSVRQPAQVHVGVEPGLFAVYSDGHLRRVNSYCASSGYNGNPSACTLPPLPPGHYLVVAFPLDRTPLGSAFNEPSTASRLHKNGISVDVKPDQTVTVQLKGSLMPGR